VISVHKEPISIFPILLVNFIGTLDSSFALLPLSQSRTRVQSSRRISRSCSWFCFKLDSISVSLNHFFLFCILDITESFFSVLYIGYTYMHGLILATPKIPSSHPCILPCHPDGNLANFNLITTRVIIYLIFGKFLIIAPILSIYNN
jgi:hypothetical protein